MLTWPEDGVDKQKKSRCIYIVILLQVELYYKQIVNKPVCGSRYISINEMFLKSKMADFHNFLMTSLKKIPSWPPAKKSRCRKSDFSKTLKMALIVEVLYSDMYFGLYWSEHPGISATMEEFKCVSDYQLGKIVCIKITMPGSDSGEPVHLEMDFSREPGSSNYSILTKMEEYFKMIPELYPEKVVFVKITVPGCERENCTERISQ